MAPPKTFPKNIKKPWWLAILAFVVLGVGYGVYAWLKPTPAAVPQPLMVVTVAPVVSGQLNETIEITGEIAPREMVELGTELSGVRVQRVLVEEGDTVTAGQVLAVLDAATMRNDSARLQAEAVRAEADYARVDAISQTGAVSAQLVAEKAAALASAKAQASTARINVLRSQIVTPVDGVVYQRTAENGALISGNAPLFKLAAHGETEVLATVPEAILTRLRLNTSGTMLLAGNPTPLPVSIRVLSPRVDGATRTASLRLSVNQFNSATANQSTNANAMLPIGAFARITLLLSQQDGDLLPTSAIQQGTSGTFVWGVSASHTVVVQAVTVRLQQGNQTLVAPMANPLPVVTRAGPFLRAGDLISPSFNPTAGT
jgi:RND family efflux transporter MFP subunit